MQRAEVTLAVVRALVVPGSPNLLYHGTGEHVQDLVSLIAGLEQSHRGVPNLRRRVVPQLRGDDLVHRQVQAGIHRPAAELDLTAAFLERLREFGMLTADHG